MKRKNIFDLANLQANHDLRSETPEQRKERKKLLKRMSRHVKHRCRR